MNIALVFAGGTGQRMNTATKPKQFLELHGKPILIYTLEHFQYHPQIDAIVLVCLKDYIQYSRDLVKRFAITKVQKIVPGGHNGQQSIFNGLKVAFEQYGGDNIVLIHDGVRPLINEKIITDSINMVIEKGNAITVSPAIETVVMKNPNNTLGAVLERSDCYIAKAPQSFWLRDIYDTHLMNISTVNKTFIDSASLMQYYGHTLYTVYSSFENIKITTPSDYYIFRAIMDARENLQIIGL